MYPPLVTAPEQPAVLASVPEPVDCAGHGTLAAPGAVMFWELSISRAQLGKDPLEITRFVPPVLAMVRMQKTPCWLAVTNPPPLLPPSVPLTQLEPFQLRFKPRKIVNIGLPTDPACAVRPGVFDGKSARP